MNSPNLQQFWADLLVEELVRQGVRHAVMAPGSRSTPLVLAIARHEQVSPRMHFDERGTAFYALGYARATGKPIPWITTSGTAVANGLPAVVEASMDAVPMLLLTADRPPELRDTAANQTIRQPDIFGTYTRWHFDLPVPDARIDPAFVLTTLDQAFFRSMHPHAGPVHLNCMFREPLAPEQESFEVPLREQLRRWMHHRKPYTRYQAAHMSPPEYAVESVLRRIQGKRGLLVVGRMPAYRPLYSSVVHLAEKLGWPLLTDIGSQLRLRAAGTHHIAHADLLLSDPAFCAGHVPEVILHIGGPLVSKTWLQCVRTWQPEAYIVVRSLPERMDPVHLVTEYLYADEIATLELLHAHARAPSVEKARSWLVDWQKAHQRVARALDAWLAEQEELTEPAVARALSAWIPSDAALFLASSMPVRDMDRFGSVRPDALPVGANRGASGIDGLVASAAGFAEGLRRPVVLLIGDLALLHDMNSLALVRENRFPVIIVVINNQGGGIFSFLPIAEHAEYFETFFGTPHPYTFRELAAQFGFMYEQPATLPMLECAFRSALQQQRPALIEVRTERARNRQVHDALLAHVHTAMQGL